MLAGVWSISGPGPQELAVALSGGAQLGVQESHLCCCCCCPSRLLSVGILPYSGVAGICSDWCVPFLQQLLRLLDPKSGHFSIEGKAFVLCVRLDNCLCPQHLAPCWCRPQEAVVMAEVTGFVQSMWRSGLSSWQLDWALVQCLSCWNLKNEPKRRCSLFLSFR